MSKKMLIDAAHPEEVRVAVVSQNKIEDFDFESAARKPLRGNIFLARVTRVEPSLQAAFVDYGGNRHGFLAFSEIHPDYYQIPVSDRKLLQDAEQEVAELAAELELSQRGDDDDGDDEEMESASSQSAADRSEDTSEDPSDNDDDHASDDDAGDDETADGSEEVRAASNENKPRKRKGKRTAKRRTEEEEEEESDDEDNDTDDEDEDDSNILSDSPRSEKESTDESETLNANVEDGHSNDAPEESDATESLARDDADASVAQADADQDADDDAFDDEDDEDDEDDNDDKPVESAKSARAKREQLFERYKNAKRKRAQLLRNYKIQEVVKRRQILLIQVVKEERGNKGAALTTYLSLAGRYCVLMPNTARGGGISRKIANGSDRRRLRRVVDSLEVPRGMGLIIRTAGAKRTKTEIKRDYDYLLRLWENIRSLTLKSIAPCLVYEEASLIKRAIRDLYDKDISKVHVEGDDGYREAKDFMKMLMPSHAKNVQPYKDKTPIFLKHGVETQLDGMYQPSVRLKSGGYIVIHQTEALVAIDVNSGRATRERNIEQTALKTNIEAAEEAARQFRLRDLAGLIVIDFIDMEEQRNNRKVERALKDAMKADRARLQVGRISPFGLLELSRQRRRSGIVDGTTQACPTCSGAGVIRSHEMASIRLLRAIEGEAISGKAGLISVRASIDVSLHVLNHHRDWLNRIEQANGLSIEIIADSNKHGDDYDLEASGAPQELRREQPVIQADQTEAPEIVEELDEENDAERQADAEEKPKRRRRRRRPRRDRDETDAREDGDNEDSSAANADASADSDAKADTEVEARESDGEESEEKPKKRRRRGRRGGRRNRRDSSETTDTDQPQSDAAEGGDDSADADSAATENPEAVLEVDAKKTSETAAKDDQVTSDAQDAQTEKASAKEPDIPAAAESVAASANGSGAHEKHNHNQGSSEIPDQEDSGDDEPAAESAPATPKSTRRGWWRRSAS